MEEINLNDIAIDDNAETVFEGSKFGDRFTNGERLFIYLGQAAGHHWLCYEEQILTYLRDNSLGAMCVRGDVVAKYLSKCFDTSDFSIYSWFRRRTSCGIAEAKTVVDKILSVLERRHNYRTDSEMKLVYVDEVSDAELEAASEECVDNADFSAAAAHITPEMKDLMKKAFVMGYRTAEEKYELTLKK